MSASKGFIAAILERPSDLFRWRVFADWLEEHREDAQAEALRLFAEICDDQVRPSLKGDMRDRLSLLLREKPARPAMDKLASRLLVWAAASPDDTEVLAAADPLATIEMVVWPALAVVPADELDERTAVP